MKTKMVAPCLHLFVLLCLCVLVSTLDVDSNGYVMFCPCMAVQHFVDLVGRFGNQADQYLGALAFAHGLKRTMVLPPWVEYRRGERNSIQVPFEKYFKVERVAEYTKVITMDRFMKELAPVVWPPAERTVFCYSARHGDKENDCNAKDGNPFGPFWDTFNIDFTASEFYGPLSYGVEHHTLAKKWHDKYPAKKNLVLAFSGSPGSFPVREENAPLQTYFHWSDEITAQADQFIATNIPNGTFLGIHMRNGVDWSRACDHVGSTNRNMFGSANCLGYNQEHGLLTKDLCLPPDETVIKQVKKTVKQYKLRTVFVATDDRDMITQFKKAMKKITFVRLSEPEPHVDLAILARADHAIVNCVSTFSAFAVRERRVLGKSVSFWAFQEKTKEKAAEHEEL